MRVPTPVCGGIPVHWKTPPTFKLFQCDTSHCISFVCLFLFWSWFSVMILIIAVAHRWCQINKVHTFINSQDVNSVDFCSLSVQVFYRSDYTITINGELSQWVRLAINEEAADRKNQQLMSSYPVRSNEAGGMIAGSDWVWKQTVLFLHTVFADVSLSMEKSSEVGLIVLQWAIIFCIFCLVHSGETFLMVLNTLW